jgi:aromatic-L-amino-acid decarboxylase
MGVEGIQSRIRKHIAIGQWLKAEIENHPEFELLAPVPMNTVCFRFNPKTANLNLDELNEAIMNAVNKTGKLFFTQTKLNNQFSLRLAFGNTNLEAHHVENAWQLIQEKAKECLANN